MLLHVIHETRYDYTPAVENAHHVVHLTPGSSERQQLISHHLRISPAPAQQRDVADVYGHLSTFFSFQRSHERLLVVASSVLSTLPAWRGGIASPAWECGPNHFLDLQASVRGAALAFLVCATCAPRAEAVV